MAATGMTKLEQLRRWMVQNRVMSLTMGNISLVVHESSLIFPAVEDDPTKRIKHEDEYADETPQQRIRRLHAARALAAEQGDSNE